MDTIFFWVIFNVFILLLLGLDLFVFHRKEHAVKVKEALLGVLSGLLFRWPSMP
jgi:tellurite resistance protein TerC